MSLKKEKPLEVSGRCYCGEDLLNRSSDHATVLGHSSIRVIRKGAEAKEIGRVVRKVPWIGVSKHVVNSHYNADAPEESLKFL